MNPRLAVWLLYIGAIGGYGISHYHVDDYMVRQVRAFQQHSLERQARISADILLDEAEKRRTAIPGVPLAP